MDNEIVPARKNEIQPVMPIDNSPMAAVAAALQANPDLDIEKFGAFFELQLKHEANEAMKAFHVAMALFKKDPPKVIKDRLVNYKQVNYKHATLANIMSSIEGPLSEQGLTVSWKTDTAENGLINVTCFITHELGHSEQTTLPAMPDTSGSKNAIQAIGSAVTYMKRYTLEALLGLPTYDDDGAATGKAPNAFKDPTKAQWDCIDAILASLPPKEGFTIDRTKLSLFFLREKGKYPSTKKMVGAAAEFVVKSGNEDMYVTN